MRWEARQRKAAIENASVLNKVNAAQAVRYRYGLARVFHLPKSYPGWELAHEVEVDIAPRQTYKVDFTWTWSWSWHDMQPVWITSPKALVSITGVV